MDKRTEKTVLKAVLGFLVVLILGIGSLLAMALTSKDSPSNEVGTTTQAVISQQQAVSIAAGVAQGKVTEVELNNENGKEIYIVELMDGNTEYDVKIDAITGNVISVEQEDELGRKELELVNPKINEEQAKAIALSAFSGKVTEFEAQKLNGRYVYEVEITNGNVEADVLVDMMSGEVIAVEKDAKEEDADDVETEEDEEEDVPITGSALDRASAAALKYIGEGSVTDTEVGDEEGYYEIEITLDNGNEVDVHLDENFNVLSTEYEDEEDDD